MSATVVGQSVGPIGYGLMRLTWHGNADDETAIKAMKAAINSGSTYWNGGEFYGTPERNSLTLLNKYFERYPEDADKIILNIKGGFSMKNFKTDGSAEFVTNSVLNCVKMLGSKGKVHQFECARRDKSVPLEETLGALAKLVDNGTIDGVCLSEVNANTIREASKITKITGVEIEMSFFATDPLRNGIVETCGELGIPIIAYSPIGRGFLTGQIKSIEDLPADDMRRLVPRYQPGNIEKNLELVREIEAFAARKGCTSTQVAINWLRCLSRKPGYPTIIPIPGASSEGRVIENSKIVDLTDADMDEIQGLLDKYEIIGDRVPPGFAALADA